ncbi:MAG: methyltransferase domain-containing protein [Acidimicrobiia bacterium]|nr:methyltransferase domain-containing protein [Acidimicrobiia bacterium]MDH4307934.1 methyltransferase domain-containing protein [Acidimicrobiia bacterium]MDH5292245.1 methyltransferase domain-containing protein [Acidimicrobiia bacterium]
MSTNYTSRRYAMVNRWDPRHEVTVRRHLDPRPGERILEVGCGRGHLTKLLEGIGVDVIGIDANPEASELAGSERVKHMYAESLTFDDDSFDKIVSVHAIEHIPQLEQALGEMARVLKPGGRALFVYPAEPIQGIWAVPTAVILHGNPLKARQVHCQWLWPRKVRAMTEPQGFRHIHSEFNLLSSPQFVTVLERL